MHDAAPNPVEMLWTALINLRPPVPIRGFHKTTPDELPPQHPAIASTHHPQPQPSAAYRRNRHSTPPPPATPPPHSSAPPQGSPAPAPESVPESRAAPPAKSARPPAPEHSSTNTCPPAPPTAPAPPVEPHPAPARQSTQPSSAATLQSCSSRSAQKSAPHAAPPQSSSASLPSADNPEKPHPQSTPAHAAHKSSPAADDPPHPSHALSDYSDEPPQSPLSAAQSAAPVLQNRSTTHGHKTADNSLQPHVLQVRQKIEQRIARLRHQHLIPRIAQQPKQIPIPFARTRSQHHRIRINISPMVSVVPTHSLPSRPHPPRIGIISQSSGIHPRPQNRLRIIIKPTNRRVRHRQIDQLPPRRPRLANRSRKRALPQIPTRPLRKPIAHSIMLACDDPRSDAHAIIPT